MPRPVFPDELARHTPSAPAIAPEIDVLHPGHFAYRHIGPRREDLAEMLQVVGYGSLDEFIDAVVPEEIRSAGRSRFHPAGASVKCCRRSAGWPG